MEKVFTDIRHRVPQLAGWCTVEKAQTLAALVLAIRPKVVLEIGVFGGRSFIPMAMAAAELSPRPHLIAIDPWSPDASLQDMDGPNKEWWAQCPHEEVYSLFTEALKREGLGENITIHRKRSDEVRPPARIDILHIDGNHGPTASMYDVNNYAPSVPLGGFVFMDDINWAKDATDLLKSMGFYQLYSLDTGALYKKC